VKTFFWNPLTFVLKYPYPISIAWLPTIQFQLKFPFIQVNFSDTRTKPSVIIPKYNSDGIKHNQVYGHYEKKPIKEIHIFFKDTQTNLPNSSYLSFVFA